MSTLCFILHITNDKIKSIKFNASNSLTSLLQKYKIVHLFDLKHVVALVIYRKTK